MNHSSNLDNDTIVALATGASNAAIGVVRLSGPLTLPLLQRFCRRLASGDDKLPDFAARPREALLCRIQDGTGEMLDDGLVSFFPGPASYTGEDVAELALHGNPLLLRRCVEIFTGVGTPDSADTPRSDYQDFARPAEPGEFTRRAFAHGKLDLSQAEAVRRLIEAKSEFELRASRRLLTGQLSRLVSRFRSALISLKAETEAEVDFSTEDLTFETVEARLATIDRLTAEIDEILKRAAGTTRAAGGFQVALMGVPNAGKSSLLNLMLGWDRAIVSDVPGTTRDYLAEEIQFEGVSVRFVDTAGLRKTEDAVEAEGVRRSYGEIQRSQIILHVVDGSRPAYAPPELPAGIQADAIRLTLINKSDILDEAALEPFGSEQSLHISCTTGAGLPELREFLKDSIFEAVGGGDPLLLEDRHRFHFEKTRQALVQAAGLMRQSAPAEIVALEIDTALKHTGEITGRVTEEEILGRIFSMFCVGK